MIIGKRSRKISSIPREYSRHAQLHSTPLYSTAAELQFRNNIPTFADLQQCQSLPNSSVRIADELTVRFSPSDFVTCSHLPTI